MTEPGDAFEREADRVADAVLGMAEPPRPRAAAAPLRAEGVVQRACDACAREQEQRPAIALAGEDLLSRAAAEDEEPRGVMAVTDDDVLSFKPVQAGAAPLPAATSAGLGQIAALGGGQPLAESARAFFEPRFGVDFGAVRVHAGEQATQLARSFGARAFTVGRDVVFGEGEYAPHTPAGRHLLAHELTHVLQQRSGRTAIMRVCDCPALGATTPSAADQTRLGGIFPNLTAGEWCITAPATGTYNCIAWSIGNTSSWIWNQVDSTYGNKDGTVDFSDFDAFYSTTMGLTPVIGSTPMNGEVALFANGSTPTHAAARSSRSCPGGQMFESKLGANVRIIHLPRALEGGTVYGNIDRFYVP